MKQPLRFVVVLACVMVLSCCGQSGRASSQQEPTAEGISAVLDTHRIEFAPNWVPVMLKPTFVEQESASKVDVWPKSDDAVHVLCRVRGGEFLDLLTNAPDTTWYRVVIPDDQVEPAMATRVEVNQEGHVGYMESFWFAFAPNETPPDCAP